MTTPRTLPAVRGGSAPTSTAADRVAHWWVSVRSRLHRAGRDRGDVPGWVLVTLMTAGLVLALWALAGPAFSTVFTDSIARVTGEIGG